MAGAWTPGEFVRYMGGSEVFKSAFRYHARFDPHANMKHVDPARHARKKRPLTPGEVAMARLVFGDAIDYATVRVHARGYLPFGLQPSRTAMAPNGNLYFPRASYRDDFSA